MNRPGRRPIDAAVIYARRGWAVFPCHSPAPGPGGCTCGTPDCGSPGKHPRVVGGLKAATTDEVQIKMWWGHWPSANVAIRTGDVSGLVVLDIDPEHGGEESLERLIERRGVLAPCRTVRTGSGGLHLYFAHPGRRVRNDAGRKLGLGIDVRGDGGYVIAPPSRHASGGRYVVEAHSRRLPPLPDWMLRDLTRQAERPRFPAPPPGSVPSRWAEKALEGELDRLRSAREGTRNDTLNRIAFRLGQLVGTGALDQRDVEGLLLEGGRAVGLNETEVVATVQSGLTAGSRLPRGPSRQPVARARDVGAEVDC